MVNLNDGTIQWCTIGWQNVKTVLFSCGSFPNMILMGTQGCINYNLSLALRQLGYPRMGPPIIDLLTPFVCYYLYGTFSNIAYTVHRAWNNVERKGRELGFRSCGAKDTYKMWVRERIAMIGLPFCPLLASRKVPTLSPEIEDLNVDRAKLLEIKKGKRIADAENKKAFDTLQKVHS